MIEFGAGFGKVEVQGAVQVQCVDKDQCIHVFTKYIIFVSLLWKLTSFSSLASSTAPE